MRRLRPRRRTNEALSTASNQSVALCLDFNSFRPGTSGRFTSLPNRADFADRCSKSSFSGLGLRAQLQARPGLFHGLRYPYTPSFRIAMLILASATFLTLINPRRSVREHPPWQTTQLHMGRCPNSCHPRHILSAHAAPQLEETSVARPEKDVFNIANRQKPAPCRLLRTYPTRAAGSGSISQRWRYCSHIVKKTDSRDKWTLAAHNHPTSSDVMYFHA